MIRRIVLGLSCLLVNQLQGMHSDLQYWRPPVLVVYKKESIKEFFFEALKYQYDEEIQLYLQTYDCLLADADIENAIVHYASESIKKLYAIRSASRKLKEGARGHE